MSAVKNWHVMKLIGLENSLMWTSHTLRVLNKSTRANVGSINAKCLPMGLSSEAGVGIGVEMLWGEPTQQPLGVTGSLPQQGVFAWGPCS